MKKPVVVFSPDDISTHTEDPACPPLSCPGFEFPSDKRLIAQAKVPLLITCIDYVTNGQ
jgi:hypothetical protein